MPNPDTWSLVKEKREALETPTYREWRILTQSSGELTNSSKTPESSRELMQCCEKVLLELRSIQCLCRCICGNYSSRSPGSGVSGDARSRLPETWDAEDAGRLERVTE
jgi:hypothetical protein